MSNRLPTPQNTHVVGIVKGGERYLFLYDLASRSEVLKTFGRFASDPGLSFTWYDAAVCSGTVRKLTPKWGAA